MLLGHIRLLLSALDSSTDWISRSVPMLKRRVLVVWRQCLFIIMLHTNGTLNPSNLGFGVTRSLCLDSAYLQNMPSSCIRSCIFQATNGPEIGEEPSHRFKQRVEINCI